MTTREFLDAFQHCTSHGWLDWEEALLLVTWAETTRGALVEIGSYQGRSAVLLAHLGRPLYCVDPWDDLFHSDLSGEEIFRRFRENTAGYPNVIPVRSRVEDWSALPAGCVYCDGDHSYDGTVWQIRRALQCQPQVIALHDVSNEGGGREVQRAALGMLGPWTEKCGKLAVWQLPR